MSKLKEDFGVRALFGVLIIAPTMAALIVLALQDNREALMALVALCSSVVGWYFGQRQGK